MAFQLRKVDYFYLNLADEPGRYLKLLKQLAELGIDLLAFASVPVGPARTQLAVFPADSGRLLRESERAGLVLDGPHPALLAQGDDELGALAGVHERLHRAGVEVYASNGVADGRGGYGYVLYVRPEDVARATDALGI